MAKMVIGVLRTHWPLQFDKAFPDMRNVEMLASEVAAMLRGLTRQQIAKGLDRAKRREFMPGPGVLAELCKPHPEDFGMPSAQAAYLEACRQLAKSPQYRKWTHPGVYIAYVATTAYVLKSETERQAFPKFEREYQAVINRVMAGEQLQVPKAERIDEPKNKPLSRREQMAQIKKLSAEVGGWS